jgi:hypothetical protein
MPITARIVVAPLAGVGVGYNRSQAPMWKAAGRGVFLFAACAVLGWCIWIVTKLVSPELSIPGAQAPTVSYAELIGVLLTGLAISLGLLGIVIAGLALWGYKAIRDESRAIASRVARQETSKRVIEYLRSPAGSKLVENEVAKRFEELKEGLAIAEAYSPSESKVSKIESGAESSKVGKPYRGKGAK